MRCTPPQTTGLISASPESQPSSSDAKTQLTDFSQIPKILSASRHDVIHISWSHFLSSTQDLLTDESIKFKFIKETDTVKWCQKNLSFLISF